MVQKFWASFIYTDCFLALLNIVEKCSWAVFSLYVFPGFNPRKSTQMSCNLDMLHTFNVVQSLLKIKRVTYTVLFQEQSNLLHYIFFNIKISRRMHSNDVTPFKL